MPALQYLAFPPFPSRTATDTRRRRIQHPGGAARPLPRPPPGRSPPSHRPLLHPHHLPHHHRPPRPRPISLLPLSLPAPPPHQRPTSPCVRTRPLGRPQPWRLPCRGRVMQGRPLHLGQQPTRATGPGPRTRAQRRGALTAMARGAGLRSRCPGLAGHTCGSTRAGPCRGMRGRAHSGGYGGRGVGVGGQRPWAAGPGSRRAGGGVAAGAGPGAAWCGCTASGGGAGAQSVRHRAGAGGLRFGGQGVCGISEAPVCDTEGTEGTGVER